MFFSINEKLDKAIKKTEMINEKLDMAIRKTDMINEKLQQLREQLVPELSELIKHHLERERTLVDSLPSALVIIVICLVIQLPLLLIV